MHANLTLNDSDMSLYMTDTFNDDIFNAYKLASEDHQQQFAYSKDKDLYLPENIAETPADWFCIYKINNQPVQCFLMSHYDWMPDDWFRMYSRMHNMYSYTKHSKWFRYRMMEIQLFWEAKSIIQRENFIITQNVYKDGKCNFENYQRVAMRSATVFSKRSNFSAYVYPSICYLNKTPQNVVYSSFNDNQPDTYWLDEFAIDEN